MTEHPGPPDGNPKPEQQLAHLLPALWRSVYQATRSSDEMPALESQTQILRKLVAVGALSPAQLAEELRLARPTISNLVRGLVADGLVERTPSPNDGRSVLLNATARGREVLLGFRADRAEVLADALNDLPPVDRRRLCAALPSLDRLLEKLDERADWEWQVRQQQKSAGDERPRRPWQTWPPPRRAARTNPTTPPDPNPAPH